MSDYDVEGLRLSGWGSAAREIERLRQRVGQVEDERDHWRYEVAEKAIQRIEELEKEREECVDQCPAPTIAQAAAMRHGERFKIVKHSQIDGAKRLRDEFVARNCDELFDLVMVALGIEGGK